eukprot:14832004-Ditylum_brightwellii.AAC.1
MFLVTRRSQHVQQDVAGGAAQFITIKVPTPGTHLRFLISGPQQSIFPTREWEARPDTPTGG